ncbi:hypothetical protein TWF281_007770 [Arthrobotrys megalospora]
MDIPKTTITSLPPELFFTIFSYLPRRTIKTVISPLSSVTRSSPSKSALQNLSLATKSLRAISAPHIFESIVIKNFRQLEEFVAAGGIGEKAGRYVSRVVMRWEAYGGVVKVEEQTSRQSLGVAEMHTLVKSAIDLMPGLKGLTMDFPGAIGALAYALEDGGALERLQAVCLRNGKWEYGGDITGLLGGLGKLRGLQTVAIDGTACITGSMEPRRALQVDKADFRELVNLEVKNVSRFNDHALHSIMRAAGMSTALTVKNCAGITLPGTRNLLVEHGNRLQYLSLEILKKWDQEAHRPESEREREHEHELYRFSDDEHLCPVIRDHCKNLQILDIHTNKICKEILFSTPNGSGAMTGGLPTPPGSPDLHPTRVVDVPTPPADAATDEPEISRTTMLPPPLFSFQHLSLFRHEEEERLFSPRIEKRQKMKRITLRIPYDSSCFGAGAGGPSLQQRYTTLCDGSPASELLEFANRAFEEGLVELANVQGHWKGGPYLIMKD